MDVAYDHIQEEVLAPDEITPSDNTKSSVTQAKGLNNEISEAYKAMSASPWGARLGGFLGAVKKQSETYIEGARQELTAASTEASKGLTGLVNQTKNLTLLPSSTASDASESGREGESGTASSDSSLPIGSTDIAKEAQALLSRFGLKKRTESSTSDIVKDTESLITRFQSEAAARLKQIQKAEDAADEALERFGLNIKSYLRDAVTIAPPSINEDGTTKSTILFESKDAEGKRAVHATRFDAQLHVIHSTSTSFTKDPMSDEYKPWKESFDVGSKTGDIAKDMGKYEELRRAMEKLVPEQVDYASFWTRYYFLRHVIETEEQRRRELLNGTQDEEEDVAWDDEEEEADERTDLPDLADLNIKPEPDTTDDGSTTPKKSVAPEEIVDSESPKAAEPRRSNEHSVAGSDASYDIVSGHTSRGPGTPSVEKEIVVKRPKPVAEESDEEDWE